MTSMEVLAAVRFAAWASQFAVAAIVAHYVWYSYTIPGYRLNRGDRMRVAVGFALGALGWGLKEYYSWAQVTAFVQGKFPLVDLLLAWSPVTVAFYGLILVGSALVVSPFFVRVFGPRRWKAADLAMFATLIAIGAGWTKL